MTTEPVRLVFRLLAARLTTNPVSATARLTASSAANETLVLPLRTRETVPRETPEAAATSLIVGLFRAKFLSPRVDSSV
jgi:hypothetical protein